jgi:hypothetical protein
MRTQKLTIVDSVKGFTERDADSKAILNTDLDALLKYKIQKRRMSDINKTKTEMADMKGELDSLKQDLIEIKSLLHKITTTIK